MSDQLEDELRAIKRKFFGGGAVDIPRAYIELVYKLGGAEGADFWDHAKGEYRAYWLDGKLFRGVTYAGQEEDALANELAYPLATLSSIKTAYSFQWDDFTRRHTRWNRQVTLHFRDEESVILEVGDALQDTDRGRLVDAILKAVAKG